ncbi:MAG: hypothetical protein HG467_002900 [Clostridiales bacterium]|nr:hypothetical protein [Clostridiales bacterium]
MGIVNLRKYRLLLIIFIVISIILFSLYLGVENFRKFVDEKVIKKEVEENSSKSTYLLTGNKYNVIPTLDNIYTVQSGQLKSYDKYGIEKNSERVSISNPIFDSSDKYATISEKQSISFYLLEDGKVKWEKKVDTPIVGIKVNKNGYVAVMSENNIYKAVVTVFNNKGDKLFKTYVSDSYGMSASISNDNKYLVIGSVNYSKTIANSNIKIVSMEKAKTDPDGAIINEYNIGKLLIDIKIKDGGEVIGQFSNSITRFGILDKKEEEIYKLESNVEFVDINNNNNIALIEKKVENENNSKFYLKIINAYGKQVSIYDLDDKLPKEILCRNDTIGINMNNGINIYTENGWLKKKYKSSTTEIRDFNLSDSILTVIYRDKYEVIGI